MDLKVLFPVFLALWGAVWLFSEEEAQVASVRPAAQGAQGSDGRMAEAVGEPGLLSRFFTATEDLMNSITPSGVMKAGGTRKTAVLGPEGALIDPAQVFDQYRAARESDMPAEALTAPVLEGCAPRRPAEGEAVHVLAASTAEARAPVYPLDYRQMDYDIELMLEKSLKGEEMYRSREARRKGYEVHDVAVTQTDAPVYLVLQSNRLATLWNIHLSPGAQVSHVLLLGGQHHGVANLPDGAGLEVMTRTELGRCNTGLWFVPPDGALIYQSAELGIDEAKASLSSWLQRARLWDSWLQARLGVSAGKGMLDDERLTAYLAGPRPATEEARAVHASLEGARLHITEADHVLAGKTWRDDYYDVLVHYAERAAGAPLSTLAPVTQTRVTQ